jgi:RNA polymerase sigma-70 factor (ECF subfamily)
MLTFHDLYTSYAPDVYRFAYWLTGNALDADDITSETFIRAWTNPAIIRTETLKAYLLAIARNVYLGQLRGNKLHTDLIDTIPDPRPGPDQQVEDCTNLETVRRVLQSLSEIDRAAFVLRIQHDLPYVEIARILRLSEGAAKVKVHRARKKMLAASLDEARD